MTQKQNQEYLENLRGLIQESGYVREPGLDTIQDIRNDYEAFRDEKGLDSSEAAERFIASAGEIAEASLDWESDRKKFFRAARDALGAGTGRCKMLRQRLYSGDFLYEGVPETSLWDFYKDPDQSLDAGV